MNLVLLTNSYPYGNQEAFLEPEIEILSSLFDEIHIYTFADLKSTQMRSVPGNVSVKRVVKPIDRFLWIFGFLDFFSPHVFCDCLFTKKHFDYSLKDYLRLYCRFYFIAKKRFMPHLLCENPRETVFYSYWFSHLAFALAVYKHKIKNAFCITRAHRFDNFIDYKACILRQYIISSMNALFPISNAGKNEIDNRMLFALTSNKPLIKVFHLGVHLPSKINPKSISCELKIVSCSFIWKLKRLDILIDALAQIDDIQISWIHFGGGEDQDFILHYAQNKLNGKDNIRYTFMGQTVHGDILDCYINNHVDIFINCSDHEGIPVSIMEAMATGIFCIARDVGGNSEIVKDNLNGYLLPANSGSKEYAQAIMKYYMMDEADKEKFRSSCIKTAHDDFSFESTYKSFSSYIIQQFNSAYR